MAERATSQAVPVTVFGLAALWWTWATYAWLTSSMDVDEGGVRPAMLAAMGVMLVVALAVPGAFGSDAVIVGVAAAVALPALAALGLVSAVCAVVVA